MLKIIGGVPGDLFEKSVFQECSKISLDGILSANIFLPSQDSGLDEQDIIIVTDRMIFTIDAKAYAPGSYIGGLNQPLQYCSAKDDSYQSMPDRLAKPLATAAYKAKQLITLLQNIKENKKIGVRNINRLGIRVESLIVIPDHAIFKDDSQQKVEEFMKGKTICRIVALSNLKEYIEGGVNQISNQSDKQPERQKIIEELVDILNDGISETERVILDTKLVEKLAEYDEAVPTQIWSAVKDKEKVLVKIFFKYPWREDSPIFFRKLSYQAKALKKARVAHVLALEEFVDLPEYIMMIYEWFENEGSLEEVVASRRGLDVEDALKIMKRLAQAIHELHDSKVRAPVILRNLQPSDILIDKSYGELNWDDVGFVIKGFENAVIKGRSSAGSEGRTIYEAPELSLLQDKDIRQTVTLDVYSLGVLLVFLLTGKELLSYEELVNEPLPSDVNTVVKRAISKNPVQRYQTVKEMLKALANC